MKNGRNKTVDSYGSSIGRVVTGKSREKVRECDWSFKKSEITTADVYFNYSGAYVKSAPEHKYIEQVT